MFEPGTQIGRYEIQRRLGRGGMGAVYAAHDAVLGRLVAIKVLAGDLDIPDARQRFVREARSAAALAHPHIVAVHDFGAHESQPYIVMEYIKGETLAEVIRRKAPVPLPEKLRWIEEIASAVGYAHKMAVIHRDIKPANLMIDRSGRVKVLDFGIARMLGTVSHTKDTIGTPGYMAPEQIVGDPVDGRADLFSIGVVFYELLSYTDAFPGETGPAITHRLLNQEPAPLAPLVPDLNPEVVPIVERALKKHASERFPDAETLEAAVSRVRRRFEDEAAAVAPTIVIRETPGGRGAAGAGSQRRPATDAIGVVTPPPADRETLARRRTVQLEAALARARTLLATGDLTMALDACQLALTFDEYHAGALELEERIRVAFTERQAVAFDQPGGAVAPVVIDERGAVETAPPAIEYAPTVLAPPRRTPPPAPPAPAAPAARPSLPTRMPIAATAVTARLRAFVAAVQKRTGAVPPERLRMGLGVVALAIIAAAVASAIFLGPAAVVPSGTLVVDAVPWGTIVAIEAENGQRQPLPSPASTPLLMNLPTGTYHVTVAGPTPDVEAQHVTVRVEGGLASVAPPVRFKSVTPEEYFEQYPAAPSPPPDAPPPPVAAPPPSPAGAGR